MITVVCKLGDPLCSGYFSYKNESDVVYDFVMQHGYHDLLIGRINSDEVTLRSLSALEPLKIIKSSKLKKMFYQEPQQFVVPFDV